MRLVLVFGFAFAEFRLHHEAVLRDISFAGRESSSDFVALVVLHAELHFARFECVAFRDENDGLALDLLERPVLHRHRGVDFARDHFAIDVEARPQNALRIRYHATREHRLRTFAAERRDVINLRLDVLLAGNMPFAGMEFDRAIRPRAHRSHGERC